MNALVNDELSVNQALITCMNLPLMVKCYHLGVMLVGLHERKISDSVGPGRQQTPHSPRLV